MPPQAGLGLLMPSIRPIMMKGAGRFPLGATVHNCKLELYDRHDL